MSDLEEGKGRGLESTRRDSKTRHAARTKGYVKRGFKKGGAGGKYTYGRPVDDLMVTPQFPNDPTRSSDEDEVEAADAVASGYHAPDLALFKKIIVPIFEELFVSGDMQELTETVDELSMPSDFENEFVKRAILLSLDRTDRERELVSRMLSTLLPTYLSLDQITKAFDVLLARVEDMRLDCPDVEKQLACFIARAVIDEVLPPSFISDKLTSEDTGVLHQAAVLLSVKRSGAMLEHIWSIGPDSSLDDLKHSIDMLVKEYLLSADVVEAGKCVQELNSPHYHHEVVKRAIIDGMDHDVTGCEAVSALLCYLYYQDIITQSQLLQGLNRVHDSLDDIVLDTPRARQLFADVIVKNAVADSLITSEQAALLKQ